MGSQSFMARFGESLVTNGYAILPIAPGTKKPGRFVRSRWLDYPDWTRHAERPTTGTEVAAWAKWPDAGIGVVGGKVAAIDIDIADDAELAQRIETLARERLGATPAVRIGKAPKRILVYRTAAPFKGIRRHPLEVLCLGQQFVAHAIHPETGEPYRWPEETLANIGIESLPVIDEAQARAFLDEAFATACRSRCARRSSRVCRCNGDGHARGETRPAHAQAGTLPAIRAALAFIPNAELDYDSWIRIGLALKGALGETGADLFASWSAQAVKNDAAVTEKTWAGFKPNSIGAGTIYHLAMVQGWKPDAGLVLDGSGPADPVHPAAGLLATIGGGPDRRRTPGSRADLRAGDPRRHRGRSHALHGRRRRVGRSHSCRSAPACAPSAR